MKKLILLLSFVLISGSVVLSQTLATETFSEPNMNLPAVGSVFNVPINATGFPANLRYIEFFLQYDPSILLFVGSANKQHPAVTLWINNTSDPTVKKITYTAVPPSSFTIVDPKLFDLQFQFLGGNSDITFLTGFGVETSRYRVGSVITPIINFVHGAILGGFVDNTITDGLWETPADWDKGVVPNAFHNVFVLGEASINSAAICNDLTIESGGKLTLNAGFSITPGGDILINSDATGTGSFLNNGDPIILNGTVKQYMTGITAGGDTTWHLVSLPVASIMSADVFLGCHLQYWNETTSKWKDVQPHPDPSYSVLMNTAMKGYSTAYVLSNPGEDKILEFVGQINDGPYNISVTNNGTSGNINWDGWNLVGNPYPSSLDVDAPGWTKDPVYVSLGVAYWDQTFGPEGGYRYYGADMGLNGGTQYIPPMQGFFVKASGVGGPYGVSNAARTHSNQNFYKSDPANSLRLMVQANDYSDETVIRFIDDAELTYEGKYDFFKMFADKMPQIYSVTSNNEELAINALPEIDENTPISLGFKPGFNGAMSITAGSLGTFDISVPVWLIDHKANVQWNLRENPVYNFVADENDNPGRFSVHFKNLTGVPGIDGPNVNIYSYNKRIYVDAGQITRGEIVVLNIMGQELVREKLSKQLNIISLPVSHSYVVVKVISDQGISSRKVFVD